MKLFNYKNKQINILLLNGYYFGGCLLKDVMFECVIQDNKIKVLGVSSNHQEYFDTFNKEYWLICAQKYVDSALDNGDLEIFVPRLASKRPRTRLL